MPKEQDVTFGNLVDSLSNQLSYIFEILLSCWNMPGVDVDLLEVGEEELAWGGVVAVGPKDHVWKFEFRGDREEVT